MIKIPVYNSEGQETGSVQVDPSRLGGEVRPGLLKQAYVRIHANKRSLNSPTKSRSQVRGSNKKLYKQKGTGNARRGDKKANILRGGGHAKAKVKHDWDQAMPAKMRRLANRNALLAKAVDGEIKLLDGVAVDAPSTKSVVGLMDKLGLNRTTLLAVDQVATPLVKSAGNISDITVTQIDRLNVYDVLSHRFLVASKADFEAYLEKFVNNAPQSKPAVSGNATATAIPATAGAA